ncbi:MAG: ABC transporter permease [Polyangiaceae bacterium]
MISILSICGVAVSSCALSSVDSVMGGFRDDLKRKILGNNAHIVIDTESQAAWEGYDDVLTRVRTVPGVVAATPVAQGEVMISSSSNLAGVVVRGVDPGSIGNVIELRANIETGKFEYLEKPEMLVHLPPSEVIGTGPGGEQYLKGADLPSSSLPDDIDPAVRAAILDKPIRPGLIIGRELARTLHVYVGDEVTLVSPLGDLGPMGMMPRTKKFRIAAIFFSGMYEYDASQVYTTIDVAQDYFSLGDKVNVIDVKVENADRVDRITPLVRAAVGRSDLRVRDWPEMNRNLFSALNLERFATFIILSIAIMVASFCIICTLLLMVTEKGKEIAVLKALGATDGAIMRIFMTEGVIIGAIGTVFGVATSLGVCIGLKWFGLRLDPDVYYIDRLPVKVDPLDFLLVAVAAVTICTLATIYPAKAASKLPPVDGLRYE